MNKYSKNLAKIISFANDIIDLKIPKKPDNLYGPIRHMASKKGKQVRGILALLSYDTFSGDIQELKELVLAIETLHNFTLIHDDVMDNAMIRRGIDTINQKWSSNQAILSGDVLMMYAYHHILSSKLIEKSVLKQFTNTAISICEGQQLDCDFQTMKNISMDEYFNMIQGKTSALIEFSLAASAAIANTGHGNLNLMKCIGDCLGKLFQIQDDYLDLYGNQSMIGKLIGGDIYEKKKTFLYISAFRKLSLSKQKFLEEIYQSDSKEKLDKIKAIYDSVDVKNYVNQYIQTLNQELVDLINQLDINEQKKITLLEFLELLLYRNS